MRSFISVILLSVFIFSCTKKDAIGYSDTIIKPQLAIVAEMDTIFDGSETSMETIRKNRKEMVTIAQNALQEIQKLDDFKTNSSFKNSAVDYFSFVKNYYSATENIDSIIYKFNSEERIQKLTENQYNETQEKFEEYLALEQKLLSEQQRFAKEFNMPLKK